MDAEALAVKQRYERFARTEVGNRSALYLQWAEGIASDPSTCALLARIPATRRQPPLVFAVTRILGAPESTYAEWALWLAEHVDEVVAQCRIRSLQTNEPLRCAALLPALSQISGPIALLEIGASAGLCLYPDKYSYRYALDGGELRLDPKNGPSNVVLDCTVRGDVLPFVQLPEVVWRAGIDISPLDAADDADRAWLAGLVWPGEVGRAERVLAALDVVAADPPLMVAANALDVLEDVAALAPRGATLVVTTPGVLAHVPYAGRNELIARARGLGRWVTIDDPTLHQGWTTAPTSWREGFAVALDGNIFAAADPLGGWIDLDVGAP